MDVASKFSDCIEELNVARRRCERLVTTGLARQCRRRNNRNSPRLRADRDPHDSTCLNVVRNMPTRSAMSVPAHVKNSPKLATSTPRSRHFLVAGKLAGSAPRNVRSSRN